MRHSDGPSHYLHALPVPNDSKGIFTYGITNKLDKVESLTAEMYLICVTTPVHFCIFTQLMEYMIINVTMQCIKILLNRLTGLFVASINNATVMGFKGERFYNMTEKYIYLDYD